MKHLDKLKDKRENSFYNKSCYEVSLPISWIKSSMIRYGISLDDRRYNNFDKVDIKSKEFYDLMIPKFQRDNNKWTKQMKIKFVENLLMGIDSIIMLGNIYEKGMSGVYCNCRIIDGQQRMNAITDWLDGKFAIFEDIYFNEELSRFLNSCHNLKIRIYTFKNEKEMVQFYIQMNENITHSKKDIEKAKEYLNYLKSE